MLKERHFGVLKVYCPLKGYGFITRPAGKDVFVFYSDFVNGADAAALAGTNVEFNIYEKRGANRPRAINVRIVG